MNVLLIDNVDSFTFMLRDLVMQCGATCDVVRNGDELNNLDVSGYHALIVSPGPETPEKAGQLLPFLKKHMENIPVMGICLGHQAIGLLYGAQLHHAEKPRHGKVDKMIHADHPMFNGIPETFPATRYHSLILSGIKDPLQITARSEQGEIMAIAHKTLPVYGVQFHPESCQTQYGLRLLKNFLTRAQG